MSIHYNAPVTLTFTLITIVIHLISALVFPQFTPTFFALHASFSPTNPLDYLRLVTHVMGHANVQHLLSNVMLILLLGPILEEKYGSANVLWIILVTALATGLVNVLFMSDGLLGASGIVFALIILVSIVNVKEGSLPLTFVLVFVLFIGRELLQSFGQDQIAQIAHVIGGIVGAVFGFNLTKARA